MSVPTPRFHLSTGGVQSALLWCVLAVATAASIGYAWYYLETRPASGNAGIELSNVILDTGDTRIHLQADARVRLPPTVQAGLDSGVPLTFVLRFKLMQQRSGWLDTTVLDVERHYTLTYYELTRHYRVSAVESDVSRNFRSLSSALAGLGDLGTISIELDAQQSQVLAQVSANKPLLGSLAMSLSKSALPLPLQPIIRSSWTLVSEEYRWPVT